MALHEVVHLEQKLHVHAPSASLLARRAAMADAELDLVTTDVELAAREVRQQLVEETGYEVDRAGDYGAYYHRKRTLGLVGKPSVC